MEQFRRLKKDFAVLACDIQAALDEKQVSLVKLRRFLKELLEGDEKLLQAATIDELFHLLRPQYCFLNTIILKDTIDEFVGEPLKQQLDQYESQLDEFTRSAKLSLLKVVRSQCPYNVDLPRVVFKLAGIWPSVTIKHFQKFVNHVFGVRANALTHIRVEDGCVLVRWFTRNSTIPSLVALAQQKVELMRCVGALCLTIGETFIMEQKEDIQSLNLGIIKCYYSRLCRSCGVLAHFRS